MIHFFKNDSLTYISHICISIAENDINLKNNDVLAGYCNKLHDYIMEEANDTNSVEVETSILYIWKTFFTSIQKYTKTSIASFERLMDYTFKDLPYPKSTWKLMRFMTLSEASYIHSDVKADIDECLSYIEEIEATNPALAYILEKRLLSTMMDNKTVFFANVDKCKVLVSKIEGISDDIKQETLNLGSLIDLYSTIPEYVLED